MNDGVVYMIWCRSTGDFYIGSTYSFKARIAAHKSDMKRGYKKGLWGDLVSKYTYSDFATVSLVKEIPRDKLRETEDLYIKTLEPTLNLIKGTSGYSRGFVEASGTAHSTDKILELFSALAGRGNRSMVDIDRELGFHEGTSGKVINGHLYDFVQRIDPELYNSVVVAK